jgi:hypothetical protein
VEAILHAKNNFVCTDFVAKAFIAFGLSVHIITFVTNSFIGNVLPWIG